MTKICSICQAELPDNMQFCPHDGARLTNAPEDTDWDELLSSGEKTRSRFRPPRTGDIIGNYQLVELLGSGGMGAVFRATHKLLEREVAVKLLLPEVTAYPEVVQRFFKEAKAVNQIRHPAIIEVTDFVNNDDSPPYMVMEMLRGKELVDYIREYAPLPVSRVREFMLPICSALTATHSIGIVHRDLKPSNIFLVEKPGGKLVPKLIDFGIAKFMTSTDTLLHTRTGELIGTPEYMAPELIKGEKVDHRIDIYAVGIIMYEMLTGQPPFQGSLNKLLLSHTNEIPAPPSERAGENEIPPTVDNAVMLCLKKNPEERIQSMGQLQEILDWVEDDDGTQVVVLTDIPQNTSTKWIWIAAVTACVTCVGALSLWATGFFSKNNDKNEAVVTAARNKPKSAKQEQSADNGGDKVKELRLTTHPEGASIYRLADGRFLGQAPVDVRIERNVKEHFIARLPDHLQSTVEVNFETAGPVNILLEKDNSRQSSATRNSDTIEEPKMSDKSETKEKHSQSLESAVSNKKSSTEKNRAKRSRKQRSKNRRSRKRRSSRRVNDKSKTNQSRKSRPSTNTKTDTIDPFGVMD